MPVVNLLYKKEYKINDKIKVRIPTVGEVVDNEDDYYDLISIFTSMPIDMMVMLDDLGIDFVKIDEWQLFLLLFGEVRRRNTTMVLGDLDLSKFSIAENEENGETVLLDRENDLVIDRAIHGEIADALRKIHHLEKNTKKPANEDARAYMIKRAREKAKRRKKRKEDSQLEALIIALTNREQFKYNFEETRELSIYQFNESVCQVLKNINYDNLMHGIYAGTVDAKEINPKDLNWLSRD